MTDEPNQTDPTDSSDPADQAAPSSWASEAADVERSSRRQRVTIVAVAVVGLLLAVGLVVAITQSSGDDQGAKVWPLDVGGRPEGLGQVGDVAEAVTPDAEPGVYLWNDFDGWHLWFVFDDEFRAASGTITSNGDIAKTVLTPRGSGTATAKEKVLTFDLEAGSSIAGIDFEPGFYANRIEIEVEATEGTLRDDMVHQGRDATVVALPIVVEKVDDPAAGA